MFRDETIIGTAIFIFAVMALMLLLIFILAWIIRRIQQKMTELEDRLEAHGHDITPPKYGGQIVGTRETTGRFIDRYKISSEFTEDMQRCEEDG